MPDTPRPGVNADSGGKDDGPLDVRDSFAFSDGYLKSRTRVVYTDKDERKLIKGSEVQAYDEETALQYMSNLRPHKGALDELKRDMYWAGFYGDNPPTVGGDHFGREDLVALFEAMDGAELSGGMEVADHVMTLAETGRKRGAPLGSEVEQEDDPGYQFQTFAEQNGITLSDQFIAERIGAIGAGESTLDAELKKIRSKFVVGAFPAWKDEIEAGQNVADIASPYKSAMSQILEIPEEQIDLKDPTLRKSLQAVGVDGKSTYKPLWMFERDLKRDDRWQYTDNALNEVQSASAGALREMGF